MKIVSKNNSILNCLTLYTPNSTGTIFSPDRYMMDNVRVAQFNHSGKRNGQGSITFTDSQECLIAELAMTRSRDGLWFIDAEILYPP